MPHIHELYDFVVTIFIVNDKRVLFAYHPRYNKWLPIGGHIELDEDPEQALYREISEESGLQVDILSSKPAFLSKNIKPLVSPNYLDVHIAQGNHKHISHIYFGIARDDKFVLSHEHEELLWLSRNDLEDPKYALSNADKFYASEAIALAQLSTT